ELSQSLFRRKSLQILRLEQTGCRRTSPPPGKRWPKVAASGQDSPIPVRPRGRPEEERGREESRVAQAIVPATRPFLSGWICATGRSGHLSHACRIVRKV